MTGIHSKSVLARQRERNGSVAFVLVLVMTLVIGAFAASVLRLASEERRHERQRESIKTLESAIDAVASSGLLVDEDRDGIQLPMDESQARMVLVELIELSDASREYKATMYHNNQPGLIIFRKQSS